MKYQLKQYIEGLKQTWKVRFGKNDVVLNPVVVEKDGFFEIQLRLSLENEPLNETKGIENVQKFNRLKKALNQRNVIEEKGFKMFVGGHGPYKNRTMAYYLEGEVFCIVKNRDLKELGFFNGKMQGHQVVLEIITE